MAPGYVVWLNLNRKSLCLRDSVVKRYALTQPQRRRGTEAIISAVPDSHNSAKSQKNIKKYHGLAWYIAKNRTGAILLNAIFLKVLSMSQFQIQEN